MRRMKTRPATKAKRLLLALLTFITACSQANSPVAPSTLNLPSPAPQQIFAPTSTVDNLTANPTQPTCLSQPGRVDSGTIQTATAPQEYQIYLPPCYDEKT